MENQRFLFNLSRHKCLSLLFALHLNTYVMVLRTLEICYFFQCEDRLCLLESDFNGRPILTFKDGPCAESRPSRVVFWMRHTSNYNIL